MPFSYGVLSIALIGALSPPLTAQEPKPRPPGATRLPAPRTITARQVGDGRIQLSWSSVPDAVKYQVTRSVPPAAQTVLPPTPDTVYLDQDVQPGSTYYYVVRAIDSSGTPGLNGGTSPLTAVAGDSAAAPVALREIKPVTTLSVTPFPTPYIEVNWTSSQGGVAFLVERAIVPNDPKGSKSWLIRTKTQSLPCCHWGVVDDGRDVPRTSQVVYRVTAIDTVSPRNRSTPTESKAVAPWTTHSYWPKAGNFWPRLWTGETLTLHAGGVGHVSMGAEGGITSMNEAIASTGRDGSVLGKTAGVTYVVTIWKDWDGSPAIKPTRVLVLP
jgi:hypothetical protein